MSEVHKSDSLTQRTVESEIFKKLKELPSILQKIGTEQLKSDEFTIGNVKFQVDFYNETSKIFGEVYASNFPLKSGHSRKIRTDILKMITIEKLKGVEVEKYLVLTVCKKDFKNGELFNDYSLIEHGDEIGKLNMLGKKTWFNETLRLFNIKVLYYVLSDDDNLILNVARSNQNEGMKK
jgi:hypothetical protein